MTPGGAGLATEERWRDLRRRIAGLYLELREPGTAPARRAEIMGRLSGLESALVRHRDAGWASTRAV